MTIRDFILQTTDFRDRAVIRIRLEVSRRENLLLAILGAVLLYSGTSDFAFAKQGSYSSACGLILSLVEEDFGALVAACAGLGAIIASAVGGFKSAWTLLVVSVGAFILRNYIETFSGSCDQM